MSAVVSLRATRRCFVVVCSTPVGLAVLALRENGALATLQKKWWQDKGECVGDDQKVVTVTTTISTTTTTTITTTTTTTIIIIIINYCIVIFTDWLSFLPRSHTIEHTLLQPTGPFDNNILIFRLHRKTGHVLYSLYRLNFLQILITYTRILFRL